MQIENLSFSYGNQPTLKDISFCVKRNAITTLIGANACGKTTLLKLMTKNLQPDSGKITFESTQLDRISIKDFAKRAAIVHQKNSAPDDLEVQALVAYGRLPYAAAFRRKTVEDEARIHFAMEATGILDLADRPMGELSGGQRQRAFIAMALAQNTPFLFLDEPTTFLDIRYQVEILRLIQKLNREFHLTIVMVLHDINQALVYSDEIIGMKQGEILVQGAPQTAITKNTIQDLYGIDLDIGYLDGRMWVLPT